MPPTETPGHAAAKHRSQEARRAPGADVGKRRTGRHGYGCGEVVHCTRFGTDGGKRVHREGLRHRRGGRCSRDQHVQAECRRMELLRATQTHEEQQIGPVAVDVITGAVRYTLTWSSWRASSEVYSFCVVQDGDCRSIW